MSNLGCPASCFYHLFPTPRNSVPSRLRELPVDEPRAFGSDATPNSPRPCSALLVFRGVFGRRFGDRLFLSRAFFTRRFRDLFCRRHFGRLRFGSQRIRFNRALCQRFPAESRFGGAFFHALRFRSTSSTPALPTGNASITLHP